MATAADFVADPSRHISPPPNPTALDSPELYDGRHVATPASFVPYAAHGTNHPTLAQGIAGQTQGGAYK